MLYRYLLFLLLFLAASHWPAHSQSDTQQATRSPYFLFPGLFEQVQTSGIFSDSKTFADCIPLRPSSVILDDYNTRRNEAAFNLAQFVAQYFRLPATVSSPPLQQNAGVTQHIEQLWGVLTRQADTASAGSLIALPNPYIVPGGRFREIYYWDSYFTMLGLQVSGRTAMIRNMVDNFASLIRRYGFIPNGNRTYYLTRSQPPYFSLMVQLLMECSAAPDSVLRVYTGALEQEYRFWMAGSAAAADSAHVVHLPGGTLLNRYYDKGDWPREESYSEDVTTAGQGSRPVKELYRALRTGAESGWDFSSRWLSDGQNLYTIHTADLVPVDLNCLLYNLEILLAHASDIQHDTAKTRYYSNAAARRRNAIVQYCWDEKAGWFCDYDRRKRQCSRELTLAGVYPLYFRIASAPQAAKVAASLRSRFLRPGGLVTTLRHTGQQWDAPNGWAPLQWMAIAGLRSYGDKQLAEEVARRWSRNTIRVFEQTGKLMEKYNVEDTMLRAGGGEYPTQDGFGWTNGVLLRILERD